MDDLYAALSAKIDEYIAAVEKIRGDQAEAIRKAVADAIAADDAEEAVDLKAMQAKIEEALAKIPPPFEPSTSGTGGV